MKAFLNSLPISPVFDYISMGKFMGYDLAAPKSFWEASDELRKEITGGCGPGKVGDYFVPDRIYCLNIKPSCQIHDFCFVVWNTKPGFHIANDLFKNNMVRINQQHNGNAFVAKHRLKAMEGYYKAVCFCGEPGYYNAHLRYV